MFQAVPPWPVPFNEKLPWKPMDPKFGCPPHFPPRPSHDCINIKCPHNNVVEPVSVCQNYVQNNKHNTHKHNTHKHHKRASNKNADHTVVSIQSTTVVYSLNEKDKILCEATPSSVSSIVRVQTTVATTSKVVESVSDVGDKPFSVLKALQTKQDFPVIEISDSDNKQNSSTVSVTEVQGDTTDEHKRASPGKEKSAENSTNERKSPLEMEEKVMALMEMKDSVSKQNSPSVSVSEVQGDTIEEHKSASPGKKKSAENSTNERKSPLEMEEKVMALMEMKDSVSKQNSPVSVSEVQGDTIEEHKSASPGKEKSAENSTNERKSPLEMEEKVMALMEMKDSVNKQNSPSVSVSEVQGDTVEEHKSASPGKEKSAENSTDERKSPLEMEEKVMALMEMKDSVSKQNSPSVSVSEVQGDTIEEHKSASPGKKKSAENSTNERKSPLEMEEKVMALMEMKDSVNKQNSPSVSVSEVQGDTIEEHKSASPAKKKSAKNSTNERKSPLEMEEKVMALMEMKDSVSKQNSPSVSVSEVQGDTIEEHKSASPGKEKSAENSTNERKSPLEMEEKVMALMEMKDSVSKQNSPSVSVSEVQGDTIEEHKSASPGKEKSAENSTNERKSPLEMEEKVMALMEMKDSVSKQNSPVSVSEVQGDTIEEHKSASPGKEKSAENSTKDGKSQLEIGKKVMIDEQKNLFDTSLERKEHSVVDEETGGKAVSADNQEHALVTNSEQNKNEEFHESCQKQISAAAAVEVRKDIAEALADTLGDKQYSEETSQARKLAIHKVQPLMTVGSVSAPVKQENSKVYDMIDREDSHAGNNLLVQKPAGATMENSILNEEKVACDNSSQPEVSLVTDTEFQYSAINSVPKKQTAPVAACDAVGADTSCNVDSSLLQKSFAATMEATVLDAGESDMVQQETSGVTLETSMLNQKIISCNDSSQPENFLVKSNESQSSAEISVTINERTSVEVCGAIDGKDLHNEKYFPPLQESSAVMIDPSLSDEVILCGNFNQVKQGMQQKESLVLCNQSQTMIADSVDIKQETLQGVCNTKQMDSCREHVSLVQNTAVGTIGTTILNEGVNLCGDSSLVNQEIVQPRASVLIGKESQSLVVDSAHVKPVTLQGESEIIKQKDLNEDPLLARETLTEVETIMSDGKVSFGDSSRVKQEITQQEESFVVNESQSIVLDSAHIKQEILQGESGIIEQEDLLGEDISQVQKTIATMQTTTLNEELILCGDSIQVKQESQASEVMGNYSQSLVVDTAHIKQEIFQEECNMADQENLRVADTSFIHESSGVVMETSMLHKEKVSDYDSQLEESLRECSKSLSSAETAVTLKESTPIEVCDIVEGNTLIGKEDISPLQKLSGVMTEFIRFDEEVNLCNSSSLVKQEIMQPEESVVGENQSQSDNTNIINMQGMCGISNERDSVSGDVSLGQKTSFAENESTVLGEDVTVRDETSQEKPEVVQPEKPFFIDPAHIKQENLEEECDSADVKQPSADVISLVLKYANETEENVMLDELILCDTNCKVKEEATQAEETFTADVFVGSVEIKQTPQVFESATVAVDTPILQKCSAGRTEKTSVCSRPEESFFVNNDTLSVGVGSFKTQQNADHEIQISQNTDDTCCIKVEVEETGQDLNSLISSEPCEFKQDSTISATDDVIKCKILSPCSTHVEPDSAVQSMTYNTRSSKTLCDNSKVEECKKKKKKKKSASNEVLRENNNVQQCEPTVKLELDVLRPSGSLVSYLPKIEYGNDVKIMKCELGETSFSQSYSDFGTETETEAATKRTAPFFNVQPFGSGNFWNRSDIFERGECTSRKFEIVKNEYQSFFSLAANSPAQQNSDSAKISSQYSPLHATSNYRNAGITSTEVVSSMKLNQVSFPKTSHSAESMLTLIKQEPQVPKKHHKHKKDKSHGGRKRMRSNYTSVEDSSIEDELVLKVNRVSLSQHDSVPIEVSDGSADSDEEPLSVLFIKRSKNTSGDEPASLEGESLPVTSTESKETPILQEKITVSQKSQPNPKSLKRKLGDTFAVECRKTRTGVKRKGKAKTDGDIPTIVCSSEDTQACSVSSSSSSASRHGRTRKITCLSRTRKKTRRCRTRKKTVSGGQQSLKTDQKCSSTGYCTRKGRKTAAINYMESEECVAPESEFICVGDDNPDSILIHDGTQQQTSQTSLQVSVSPPQKQLPTHTRKRKRRRCKKKEVKQ
ncbi:hypothetical protein PR048_030659 [Dryococelus australis]|uniref:Uncharacterized protein n=1 Tax=Dryococelus australis TaxID=614101 RepID=A0ABQ9GC88_9NEOP|nr:hypothetical protein PR048_030659 [Dryococelus australis]